MAKKKSSRGRQSRIPETQEPDIKEIDEIAGALSEAHNELTTWKNRTTQLRGRMMAAMQKHDRTLYEYDGVRYEIAEGEPKLKLKLLRDDEAEAAE